MVDIRETYTSKEGDQINLFYGKNRIYITFRKDRKNRLKLGKVLSKLTKKLNEKDIKKAKEKRKNLGEKVSERPLESHELNN